MVIISIMTIMVMVSKMKETIIETIIILHSKITEKKKKSKPLKVYSPLIKATHPIIMH